MFRRSGGGWVLAAVLLGGCSSPPQAEIEAAQAALGAAEGTGAESYAPDAYDKAQESLALATAAATSSMPMSRAVRTSGSTCTRTARFWAPKT